MVNKAGDPVDLSRWAAAMAAPRRRATLTVSAPHGDVPRYCAVQPPSIETVVPVIVAAASLQR